MRPKIAIALLLAGIAGVAVIYFLKPATSRPQTATAPIIQPVAAPEIPPSVAHVAEATNQPSPAIAAQRAKPTDVTPREPAEPEVDYVEQKINRLDELQSNDDPQSLQEILAELTNTNRMIRHEAIEATIQFGGHTAVPVLQGLAARTWDPGEKQELLEAAEFLALPSLEEVRAENAKGKIVLPQNSSPAPAQP